MPKRTSTDINIIASRIAEEMAGKSFKPPAKKNRAAVILGRLGGRKGGPARAQALSRPRRKEIARQAALARWKKKNRISVTVCIAAICENLCIVCASDRMLTQGDVEFEPQQSKIRPLTNAITLLCAGDSSLQDDIFQLIRADVNNRITRDPQNWLMVADIVNLYVNYYHQIKKRMAENIFLSSMGLDADGFIKHQKEMDSELVIKLADEMIHYEMPYIETIIAGRDTMGAHIYIAENNNQIWKISCRDSVGFASIGAGQRHADSEFMFAQHAPSKILSKTLLLIYSAKKRAESAPGVGTATDMLMIGPMLGQWNEIKPDHDIFKAVKSTYESKVIRISALNARANEIIQTKIDALAKAKETKQEVQPK